jgi:hypothetical protein
MDIVDRYPGIVAAMLNEQMQLPVVHTVITGTGTERTFRSVRRKDA